MLIGLTAYGLLLTVLSRISLKRFGSFGNNRDEYIEYESFF